MAYLSQNRNKFSSANGLLLAFVKVTISNNCINEKVKFVFELISGETRSVFRNSNLSTVLLR